MKKLGFRFDMARCIGCRACQLACKEANRLPAGVYFRRVDECRPAGSNGQPAEATLEAGQNETSEAGKPNREFFYSGACNHCQDPACVAVCPVGAMYVAEDGTVRHNDAVCMGCQRCVLACPYGEVIVHPATGLAAKCDSCAKLRGEGLPPACTGACPTNALEFGCIEDMIAEAKACGEESRYTYGGPSFLPDPGETLPSLLVKNVPEAAGRDQEASACAFRAWMDAENENAGQVNDTTSESAAEEAVRQNEQNAAGAEGRTADLLILGGGIAAVSAALSAAEKMREEGKEDFRIVICGDEKGPAYCRPLLSKGLLKGFSLKRYQALTEEAVRENRIDFRDRMRAVRIDPERHVVQFEDAGAACGKAGEQLEIQYRKLLLATGAEAFVPPILGTKEADILTVRKAADTERLRKKTLRARSAIVVGGGFIGLEIAWQLKELGLGVTVLEGLPKLLGRLVDLSTSELVKQKMQEQGMQVMTGVSIARFRKEKAPVENSGKEKTQSVVCLADGTEIKADFIVLSTGVRANTKLAAEAGAECGRNIRISKAYETSLQDVYACGDCAEMEDGSLKQSWTDAVVSGRQAGRVAGAVLAGQKQAGIDEEIPDAMMVNIAGTHILSAGLISEDADTERIALYWKDGPFPYRVNKARKDEARGVFFFRENLLAGACAVGSLHKVRFLQDAVRNRYDKNTFLKMAEEGGMHV